MISRENRFKSAARQRYRIGDIVFSEEHKCEAVIMGSIRDLVTDSKDTKFFKIKFEDGSESAWHHENSMRLVEALEQRHG